MGLIRTSAILLIFALVGLEAEKCPPESEILPCTCTGNDEFALTCVGIKDVVSFGHMLSQSFFGKTIRQVLLRNIQESNLKRGSFKEISVHSLAIINSTMVTHVAKDFFEDMTKELKFLIFLITSLTSIPVEALSKLNNLRSVWFTTSKIHQVLKKDIEKLPKSIAVFGVSASPLSYIEKGSFESMVNLKILHFNKCQLKTLPSNLFVGQYLSLYLRDNEFGQVPFEKFSMMSHSTIYLMNNTIRVFPNENSGVKKFFEAGNRLDISENKMQCTCEMKWVTNFEPFRATSHILHAKCWDEKEKKYKKIQSLVAADFADC